MNEFKNTPANSSANPPTNPDDNNKNLAGENVKASYGDLEETSEGKPGLSVENMKRLESIGVSVIVPKRFGHEKLNPYSYFLDTKGFKGKKITVDEKEIDQNKGKTIENDVKAVKFVIKKELGFYPDGTMGPTEYQIIVTQKDDREEKIKFIMVENKSE